METQTLKRHYTRNPLVQRTKEVGKRVGLSRQATAECLVAWAEQNPALFEQWAFPWKAKPALPESPAASEGTPAQ